METIDTARASATRRRRRGRRAAACALLLAAALAVAGCGSSADKSANSDAAPQAKSAESGRDAASAPGGSGTTAGTSGATGTGSGGATGKNTTPRAATTYLVRTADLTVRTPHVEQQLDAARSMAAAAGGYAGDEQTTIDAHGHASSLIQLRVPAGAYDAMLARLAGLGTLLQRTVQVQDVTGQVVDVASRIASQKASVARVRALMDRASSLSDVVSLESELSTRESALEALEAQQDSLRSQTDLATISLRLTEPPAKPVAPKAAHTKHDGFWTAVGHGLRNGWHAFSVTLRVVLVVAAVVLPFALLALLVWFGYRRLRRWLPGAPAGRGAERSSLRAPDGRGARVPGPAVPAYPGTARKPEPDPGSAPDPEPGSEATAEPPAG